MNQYNPDPRHPKHLPSSLITPPAAGQYSVVYADPPWMEHGSGSRGGQRGADRHYPLMKTGDIAALPVAEWAAANAHLYLWVTNNFLPDGLEVMRAWGFRYVTCITWAKTKPVGLGQYFRGLSEHCLFGVRGDGQARQKIFLGSRVQGCTLFWAERGAHSEKPEKMRAMIMSVSEGPYLEMFARRASAGWDLWGNEAPSDEGVQDDQR